MTGDVEAATCVVGQHRSADERGIGRGGAGVVHGDSGDRDRDRRSGRLSVGVGGRVGERVGSRISGGRRVGVGTARRDNQRAVRGVGIAGNNETATSVVGQHGRSAENAVGGHGAGVGGRLGCDEDRHRGGGRVTGSIDAAVCERIRSRVVRIGPIDVGAVRRDAGGAMGRGSHAGNGEAGSDVVGQDRRTVERRVGRRDTKVVGGGGGDGEVYAGVTHEACGVLHRVAERVRTRVPGVGRVDVGPVGVHNE